jgi:hypothetical protein
MCPNKIMTLLLKDIFKRVYSESNLSDHDPGTDSSYPE